MNRPVRTVLRWLLLIAVPGALALLERHHPHDFAEHPYETLNPMAETWYHIHLLQAPLFGLMAVAVLLLTYGHSGIWPILSRVGTWVFIVYYNVLDGVAGIAIGAILTNQTPEMNPQTVRLVVDGLYNSRVVGGVNSWVSHTGSWGWAIGVGAAVVSLYLANRAVRPALLFPPLLLLAGSTYCLYVGHSNPYGPIAFGCFAAAGVWFEVFGIGPAAPPEGAVSASRA